MGDFIVLGILAIILGAIIYYLLHSLKTKGTTCTSCTSCPIVEKCDKDTVKADIINYYESNK